MRHDFTEFMTFDAHQSKAAAALGLVPVTG
jgi:hypothetical protein